MDKDSKHLTISQLSSLIGVSRPTLRFWEKEFEGIFTPLRTPGGQRRYTDVHINLLKEIISLKSRGLKLTEIRDEMVQKYICEGSEISRDKIDILADRINEAVKREIQFFFQENEKGNSDRDIIE